MKSAAHLVGVTLVALVACTDPVEEARAPSGAPSQPSPGAREVNDSLDESEAERARQRRVALAAPTDTVAAEVAAGLEDGGTDYPTPEPAPTGAAAVADDGAALGGAGGEPSEYVRPVIHADVIENFSILRFALAEDVVDREPVMISSRFRRDSGPMHVFLEVRNQTGEDVTLLVGFRPASVPQRGGGVSLTVPPSPRYRTRARGNTRRASGEWVCEVMDEHQRVLVTQRFFITPEVTPAAATVPPEPSGPAAD